ncbi:Hypothetical predicted protein, partial [Olea europaea subsp. europaea]
DTTPSLPLAIFISTAHSATIETLAVADGGVCEALVAIDPSWRTESELRHRSVRSMAAVRDHCSLFIIDHGVYMFFFFATGGDLWWSCSDWR